MTIKHHPMNVMPGIIDDNDTAAIDFDHHLKHASEVVATWPVWKQKLLGGEATKGQAMKWITKNRRFTDEAYLLLADDTGKIVAKVEESSDEDGTYYAGVFDDGAGKFVSIGFFTCQHLATQACETRCFGQATKQLRHSKDTHE